MIVDVNHPRRAWRPPLTQALALPVPLGGSAGGSAPTSPPACGGTRTAAAAPPLVIRELAAALADPVFGPSRSEGFAAIVAVEPCPLSELEPLLCDELGRLERSIRAACNREHHLSLHGCSRF